jgi:L-ascorbate metabolism protein UlaG (beta-lactamase superfamily)
LGARKQRDTYRGYNGYVLERNNRRIVFGGDTALSDSFAELRVSGPIDLAIMPIGAYNPWIHSHCTPEQAVHMANEAGAHFVMPVHHQTFRLSSEEFRKPIERFQAALHETPERIALREIGETFVLPEMPIFPSCPLTRRVIDTKPYWFGGGNSKRLMLLIPSLDDHDR